MGAKKQDGAEYKSANGYWYVKVDGRWRLKHHVVAEAALGRPLSQGERIVFKDKNTDNLDPSNIVVLKKKSSKQDRIHYLENKIRVLQEELDELRAR